MKPGWPKTLSLWTSWRDNADAVTDVPVRHSLADFGDLACDLVAHRDGCVCKRRHPAFVLQDADVGVAQPGGLDVDDDFAGAGDWFGDIAENEWFVGFCELPSLHVFGPFLSRLSRMGSEDPRGAGPCEIVKRMCAQS